MKIILTRWFRLADPLVCGRLFGMNQQKAVPASDMQKAHRTNKRLIEALPPVIKLIYEII